jgi:hypothetical protein
MNTLIASLAAKIGLTSKVTSVLADVALFLTLITMVPYEKELMQFMPVTWTPYIIKAGLMAQVALRFLKMILQGAEHTPVPTPVKPTTP